MSDARDQRDPGDAPSATPMTPERWKRLSPLIDAALDRTGDDRRAYINEVSAGDAAFAAELARLVDATERGDTGSIIGAGLAARAALLPERDAEHGDARSLREHVTASLSATYTIEHEIDGAGMSRVFVAEEVGLGRRVVIKVLPPVLGDGVSSERFAREIRLAASLQQANIVPVLAAGTAGGHSYYTMPFVEGRSLRDRLAREGQLPVADAVSILRDVARALAFAHARGVVHRDIKPGNVLLSDRTAVVTDFGIAKALGDARRASGVDVTLTQAGTGIGTPAYIAPEQAAGDPGVDHRADIYAWGCLAYELFTGSPPFIGRKAHEIIAAHFNETPRRLDERRADVPAPIAELISRCLEKSPSRRPQTADELIAVIDAPTSSAPIVAPARQRPLLFRAAIVAGIAIVAAVLYAYANRTPEPLTFAVVPFRNTAHDTALDYRSDGVGDEILNGMSRLRGVQVVGRIAAARYKDRLGEQAPDVQTIGRELGARLVLMGTLREDNGRVTISAQLNDANSRGELWAQSFTRDARNLGSITDDIVSAVTEALRSRYGARIATPAHGSASAGTANGAALDLYLVGQQQLRRRGAGVRQAVQSFEGAIALDPNFGRAHAALATALELEPYFMGTPPSEIRDRVSNEARRALELDSTIADARVALGIALFTAGDWEKSDEELRHAVVLEPDNASARQTFARHLVLSGRPAEALVQLDRARKVEPTWPVISSWRSYAFFLLGKPDSALAESARSIQLDSTNLAGINLGALVNLALGRNAVARRLFATTPRAGEMSNAAYVYARLGDTAAANRVLRAAEANDPRPWFTDVAQASVRLALGDSAGALTALERSARTSGAAWVSYIPLSDPTFDLVRRSPRFVALLRQVHLDPGAIAVPPKSRGQ